MEEKKTYYDVLNINKNASAEEIKHAYRKLIKLWHPDLHFGDENAVIRTREINEAYEVLIDPVKKARYDEFLNLRNSFNPHDDWASDPMEYSDDVHYEEMTFYEYTESVASETYAAYRDSQNNTSPKTENDSSVTWRIPEKDELKQLKKAMFSKAIRVMLSSLLMSSYIILIVWIRKYLGFDLIVTEFLSCAAILPVVLYFYLYRSALFFGERYALDEEIESRSLKVFFWFFINAIPLAPLFMFFADKMGFVSYILIVAMSILTYWKELFMLILFVMGKYTVKDGDVYYAKKERKTNAITNIAVFFSLVYKLEFEDAAKRWIPVMVDRYTFRKVKEKDKALLINYRYGDTYMFEIIRLWTIDTCDQ